MVEGGVIAGLFFADALKERHGRLTQLRTGTQINIQTVGIQAQGFLIGGADQQTCRSIELRLTKELLAHRTFTGHGVCTQGSKVTVGVH